MVRGCSVTVVRKFSFSMFLMFSFIHASFAVRAVVGGAEHVRSAKVSGIRATLGFRSGTAALENIAYSSAAPTGNRLRLHLTIDQSFKDRLAQAKKTTTTGQWSPISLTPECPALTSASGHNHGWNVDDFVYSGNDIVNLASILEDGAQYAAYGDHGNAQQMTMETSQCGTSCVVDSVASATPADLSDLSAVDLLHFPADWNVELTDVDVSADFSPLTDILPSLTDLESLFPPKMTDQSGFLGAQQPFTSELFPVYDDVIGAYAVGDGPPMFDGFDDIWWNTTNIGHAISVQ